MRAASAALIALLAPFGVTAQDTASYSIDPQQAKWRFTSVSRAPSALSGTII